MLKLITSNNMDKTQSIQYALNDCEDKLSLLFITVHKQHWQQLAQHIQAYETAIDNLKSEMQGYTELPPALIHQFQYLSTQQRRIMRSIHQHMQQTSDDLQSIEQGILKLQQTSQFKTSAA